MNEQSLIILIAVCATAFTVAVYAFWTIIKAQTTPPSALRPMDERFRLQDARERAGRQRAAEHQWIESMRR